MQDFYHQQQPCLLRAQNVPRAEGALDGHVVALRENDAPGAKEWILLMIDILHSFMYQNVAKTLGILVVEYMLGDAGLLSSTLGSLEVNPGEPKAQLNQTPAKESLRYV